MEHPLRATFRSPPARRPPPTRNMAPTKRLSFSDGYGKELKQLRLIRLIPFTQYKVMIDFSVHNLFIIVKADKNDQNALTMISRIKSSFKQNAL